MQVLQQKRPFLRQQFEILEGKLKVSRQAPFNNLSIEIPFEEIGGNTFTTKGEVNWRLLLSATFMFIVLCAKVFFLIFGDKQDYGMTFFVLCLFCAFSFLTYVSSKKTILLAASSIKYIEFYEESPNKTDVLSFLSNLQEQARKHLLYKYAKRDEKLPLEEQVKQVNWLKNRNVITQEEYKQIVHMYSYPKIDLNSVSLN